MVGRWIMFVCPWTSGRLCFWDGSSEVTDFFVFSGAKHFHSSPRGKVETLSPQPEITHCQSLDDDNDDENDNGTYSLVSGLNGAFFCVESGNVLALDVGGTTCSVVTNQSLVTNDVVVVVSSTTTTTTSVVVSLSSREEVVANPIPRFHPREAETPRSSD